MKKAVIFSGAAGVIIVALVLWWAGVFSTSKPNVVLIIIDALRGDNLGCYGFNGNISPEIDEMASQGVLFENVLSQSSWTRPSIGSMLTGKYPRSIGIYKEQFDILADEYLTLAEILKKNRYTTIGITANPNINSAFNFHQGFDDYTDSSAIWNWMKTEPDKKKLEEDVHLPQSREIFNVLLEKAKQLKKKTPVYLQVNIMEVHSPYLTRDEYKQLFQLQTLEKPNKYYPEQEVLTLVNQTHGAVRQVSGDIGDFVKQLCALPGWEKTVFIITSDHGQGLDDHPDIKKGIAHGYLLYKSHVRVPLILYQTKPAKEYMKNKRVRRQVRLMDMMPTLLDYLGITPPKNIQGVSVLDLVVKKDTAPLPQLPEYFIAETHWRDVNKIAIYQDKWEYIENYDNWPGVNRAELQSIDIKENGILTDEIQANPETAKKLKRLLHQWLKKYPKVKDTQPSQSPGKKETQQLKTLGYLDNK